MGIPFWLDVSDSLPSLDSCEFSKEIWLLQGCGDRTSRSSVIRMTMQVGCCSQAFDISILDSGCSLVTTQLHSLFRDTSGGNWLGAGTAWKVDRSQVGGANQEPLKDALLLARCTSPGSPCHLWRSWP